VKFIAYLKSFFFSDSRTSRLSKNILYSFGMKGYAMLIQFALIPITLGYLDKFQYGIWLVLASIIEWFAYLDIGIGHGLRNRLSEALAEGNVSLARIFTSTSYAIITIIFTIFILLFSIINPFLDWSVILNTSPEMSAELGEIVYLVFIFFCIRFILSLITPIIFANQDPAINSMIGPLGSTISLLLILIFAKFVSGSLYWIAIIFSSAPLLVMATISVVLFSKRYRTIRPDIKCIDFSYSKRLLGLGINFFIIQIASLVIFSSANIILTQLYGPEEVTVFNIAQRYFTILLMVNAIIISPYWSSFTEAFHKKDIGWIRNSIKKLNYITYLLVAGLWFSFFVSDQLVLLWVGKTITLPLALKIAFVIDVSIQLVAAPYNIFMNGVSKIRLPLMVATASIIITIPIALFFAKVLNFGSAGVIMAIICTELPAGILWRIQYHKIINGTATGIWNK
jgi:O-antigen/teichoic acid export membrane protein